MLWQNKRFIADNLTQILLGFLLLIIAFLVMQRRKASRRMYQMLDKIPDVDMKKYPIIGHAHHFLDLQALLKKADEFGAGPPRKAWLCNIAFVIIASPEDFEIVFNNTNALHKHFSYEFGRPYIGEGLTTAPLQKWKKNRKMMNPAFNQAMLNTFVETYYVKALTMNEIIKQQNGNLFDAMGAISNCVMDAVCVSIMDIPFDCQTTKHPFATATIKRVHLMAERVFNVFLYPQIIFSLTSYYRELRELTKFNDKFTLNVIAEKRKDVAEKQEMVYQSNTKKKFLELLIEATEDGHKFTDQELLDEVNTFFAAAIDTSTQSLGFLLLSLAVHQDIQDRVFNEIIDVVGHDNAIDHTHLPRLEYLDRVVKENLRLFPPVPIIAREVKDEDVKLESCTLPVGCSLAYSLYSVNRSPLYYKNPLVFDPDRFLPEEVAKRPLSSWVPFAGGPRRCIGGQYAIMTIKTIAATILRKFRFETVYKSLDEVKLEARIIMTSAEGFPVRAFERN